MGRFRESGYDSLRTYANQTYFEQILPMMAVATVAGAVSGAVGGLIGRVGRHRIRTLPS